MSATTAKVATECARRLRLDETQTYVLLRRALDESEMPRPSEATEEVVREVMRFYFRERLGTIKCAHALLSRTSGDASSGADGDAWERAVTKERWATAAPGARVCHPREEHLAPLFVAAGAAGGERGYSVVCSTWLETVSSSVTRVESSSILCCFSFSC